MDSAEQERCGQWVPRAIIDAPRWLLLVAVVFAPWAYGSTRPWSIWILSFLLAATTVLWVVNCAWRRRWPRIHPVLAVAVACLLAHGWWMVLNSKSVFDPDRRVFIPTTSFLTSHAGSVDRSLSADTMVITTALLFAMFLTIDLTERSLWRKRLLLTAALTGVSIALFGIAQKIGGSTVLSWTWEPEKIELDNNFAMFRYRGNAGAYLNLIFPLVAGFTLQTFRRKSRWRRAFWTSALLIVIAAIQLNPSRASGLIAVLLGVSTLLFACWCWLDWQTFSLRDFWKPAILATGAIGSLALICAFGQWETGWKRIALSGLDLRDRSPTEIYLAMIPDAGLFGFGPGTFRAAFPGYQLTYDFGSRRVPEFWTTLSWLQAHNDYLQCLIEWGYLGTALWTIVILGGLGRALQVLRAAEQGEEVSAGSPVLAARRRGVRGDHLMLGCAVLAVIGMLIHAIVDFPLQIASLQLNFCILLGLCWCAGYHNTPSIADE